MWHVEARVCSRGSTCDTWGHVWRVGARVTHGGTRGTWRYTWCVGACVAVRGHLSAVSSLFPPCGYQGWNLGLQAWQASVFTHCAIPMVPKPLIQEQNKSRQCLLCFEFLRQVLTVVQTDLELVIQSQSPQEVLGWQVCAMMPR